MNLDELAIIKAINHNWEEAIEVNQQILDREPQDVDALNRLAQAYFQLDDLKSSIATYKTVLEIDPLNPIAKRKLQQLKSITSNPNGKSDKHSLKNIGFIEEPGKTKVVSLVRIGEKNIIAQIQPCTKLKMNIRMQTVCLYHEESYIGRLPDDISRRLIWLYKRDNRYSIHVKAISKEKITVFIKETKRSYQNKLLPSFQILAKEF
jgi:tetratricopeptide (TPR) repeat protein